MSFIFLLMGILFMLIFMNKFFLLMLIGFFFGLGSLFGDVFEDLDVGFEKLLLVMFFFDEWIGGYFMIGVGVVFWILFSKMKNY